MALFLVPPRRNEFPSSGDIFDALFTWESLQVWLRDHSGRFVEDASGGLLCRECRIPAVHRTLYLKIRINRIDSTESETTRGLPVCVMCQGWDDQVANLCLTSEEAVAHGFVKLGGSEHRTSPENESKEK
jgi:hypothetical protein